MQACGPERRLALPHLAGDVVAAWARKSCVRPRTANNLMRPWRPSSLQKRSPSAFRMMPPTPRRAWRQARTCTCWGWSGAPGPGWCPGQGRSSAARNLILASASSGFTRPVGCTCTHSRSMVFAPISCQGQGSDLAPLLAPATATHKPSRPATLAVHPRPGLAHLDAVARAVLAVGGGQVQQVGPILGQQRVLGEVRAEAACRTKTDLGLSFLQPCSATRLRPGSRGRAPRSSSHPSHRRSPRRCSCP